MSFWRNLLYPFALLFGAAVGIRNWLYRHGYLKIHHLNRPVISVGNLAMGGTGKSPICAELLKLLREKGLRAALLSRGYGRRDPATARIVTAEGDWQLGGDEPTMIARRHPEAMVCVGPSRFEAARLALKWHPDVYLVDDGFQHRQLARDLDMVLLDVTQPFPRLFPVGLFREGWRALRRADVVVLTRWSKDTDTRAWENKIRRIRAQLPILRAGFRPSKLVTLDGSELPLTRLRGKRIGVFSGIAKPHAFRQVLVSLGAEPALHHTLRDHQPMSTPALREFGKQCRARGLDLVVTTEKDWIKLDKKQDFDIVVAYLSIEVFWEDVKEVCGLLNQYIKKVH